MAMPDDRTRSSTRVLLHRDRTIPFRPAGPSEHLLSVHAHIEEHLGFAPYVMHDLVGDLVHVDLYPVPPSRAHPWWTVVTNGMSGSPMRVPGKDGRFGLAHAELVLGLPRKWPVGKRKMTLRRWIWPFAMLAELARFPHAYDTWFAVGQTISNGIEPDGYVPETPFAGAVLTRPRQLPRGFQELRVRRDVTIEFLAVVPLHPSELRLAQDIPAGDFASRLARHGVTEVLDPGRTPLETGNDSAATGE